jgi:hypothetical protein
MALVVAAALVAGVLAGPAAAHASTASTVASTALGQLGQHCSTRYGMACGVDNNWCSAFAKWVWNQAGINTTGIDTESGSFFGYGAAHGTLTATPHVGDAVVFNLHRGSNGDPVQDADGHYNADHVGLVVAVAGSTFTMVGGNERNEDATKSVVAQDTLGSYVGAPYGSDTISAFVSFVGSTAVTPMDTSPISGRFFSGIEGVGLYESNERHIYLDDNRDGVLDQTLNYGTAGDVAIAGGWTGSSTAGTGVFRGSTGTFYLDSNRDGVTDGHVVFGTLGDLPVMGDWNGDGLDGVGVFRPSTGKFYLDDNLDGVTDPGRRIAFGTFGDLPVVGDWNGDGRDGIGVFRPSTGMFYLDDNLDGSTDANGHVPLGTKGDRPVSGDWNGDFIDGVGVYRANTTSPGGVFYLDDNHDGSIESVPILADV